ncbi:AAA family ATPase [Mesorhizobium sp. KR1-2]|uniref:GumC family protein n=1 Tax=Mesorhizobium sp. KR1-2 TaxID=3156609 RepID=UPI0032B3584F
MTIATVPPDGNLSFPSMRYAPRIPTEAKSDDFDLTSGLRLIRRRIVMILVLSTLLMIVAVAQISGLKPTYHAESRLMIHRPLVTTLGAEDTAPNERLDLTSETERLLSRSIAERVIRDLHLDERAEFNPALRNASFVDRARKLLRNLTDGKTTDSAMPNGIESTIPAYYKSLSVRRDSPADVIRIGFDAGDPELAAAVPNRLIGIYLQERQDSLRNRLDEAEEWIHQRIAEQQDRVNAARGAAGKYGETMGIASNDEARSEQIKAVMELSDRLTKVEQSRTELKATISTLEGAPDPSLALQSIVVPDRIGAMQRDLRVQQQDLDRLLETYGNNAAEVVDLRAKILKSSSDLGLEVDRYLQSQRSKLAALDREEGAVQSALALARGQSSRLTLAQTELLRLERIADKEQTALDKLEEQRRALAAQAMLPVAEVEVLSPPEVPLQPQGRGRLFYLVGALLASISVAVTAAFVREMLDKTVRSHDQLGGIAGAVPAGFIPGLRRKDRKSLETLSGHIQDGMFAETIRALLLSLKQSTGGKLPGSIVVTSAHSGEGKSLVARALAVEIAASGNRVLLVDGDLRRGNLSSFFDAGPKHGLNEFLSGQAGVWDVIGHHVQSGIDFIPSGDPGLHQRPRLTDVAEIIEVARSNGHVVIFDSAPVLASTDTMYLTALAERTVMVVQWARTSQSAIEYALQRLKSIRKAEILVIINRVNPDKHALYSFRDSELFIRSLMKYHNSK